MTTPAPLLLHVYATFKVGGPQMRFAQLANHFGPRYRHRIIAMDGETGAMARLAPEIDARVLDVPIRHGETLGNLKTFRALLRELHPDLLVTSNWGSIEWAMANLDGRVRHVHMEDGFGPEEANRQLPRRVWTRRIVLRRSTIILPSMTLYGIARNIWRLPERHLHHIPNGVDCARFGGGPDRQFAAAKGIMDGDEPVIGTVAALRAEKNLSRLLDAVAEVARLRPVRLAIVGDGAEMPKLKARAAELGIGDRVIFTGSCGEPERLLPSFSVFALSSDTEQMPLSILEAMACGLPIAATDVGDVRNMVSDENRAYVVRRDAPSLAKAILGLLDNPLQARAAGRANALRAAEVFEQSLMFAAYRKLFDGKRGQPATDDTDDVRRSSVSRQ
ncbi:glycosyltransferase family 4 protein [Telmatospirillum sp.]|uniref:glycosyltransferase family 4 protein n=1 Tax=Telmatospirillum sp. TaxID=2079197 RepID=UPI0028481103|nr:glycosyltransferase family 4 protein [Telmatospirillum sp.]MDR3437877.1 glycosyltransferase family 4 protein [Telmatospirillum sp.]